MERKEVTVNRLQKYRGWRIGQKKGVDRGGGGNGDKLSNILSKRSIKSLGEQGKDSASRTYSRAQGRCEKEKKERPVCERRPEKKRFLEEGIPEK